MIARLALTSLLALGPTTPAPVQEDERTPLTQAPETFPLEVAFRTSTSIYKSGEPVPDVTLEVGVAQELDPVEYLSEPVLARLVTNDEGVASATLQVPLPWKNDPEAHVWVRVASPGLQRWTLALPLDQVREQERPRTLIVKPGGTVFGSVRTPSGDSVPGARVWFLQTEVGRYYSSATNERGHFVANFQRTGSYRTHVRAGLLPLSGALDAGRVYLDPDATPPVLELVLAPTARITGRIADPAGEPVQGASLLFVPAGANRFPDAYACARAERDGKLLGGAARADASGRFELGALVPGTYDVHVRMGVTPQWAREERARNSSLPLHTGRPPRADGFERENLDPESAVARVEVDDDAQFIDISYALHRVEIALVDQLGDPVSPFRFGVKERVQERYLRIEGVGPYGWLDEVYWPLIVEGVLIYELEPEREYSVRWQHPEHRLHESLVRTGAAGPWLSRLEIQLAPPQAPANLHVEILGPSGTALDLGKWSEPQVEIRSAATALKIVSSVHESLNGVRDARWTRAMPPGEYVVEANAEPVFGCMTATPLPRSAYVPATTKLELAAGEERVVYLQLEVGGHLDLESLDGTPAPCSRDPRFDNDQGIRSVNGREAISRFGGGVASLSAPGREPVERLRFDLGPGFGDGANWIVPGWPARCLTPIPPGTWTLRVVGGAGLLFEQDITIEAGAAATVRW